MPKAHNPRRGSMQFWPRKRSRHSLVRVRSWKDEKQAKPLGFICFKAGMTHVMANDNRGKSITKGETIALPTTIVECPPMTVFGISFYKKSMFGLSKSSQIYAEKAGKHLSRRLNIGKKRQDIEKVEFDDLRILVHSNSPKSVGTKKPKVLEIALGGSKDEKLAYAKEKLGKSLSFSEVFEEGQLVDTCGVTKGKGFQGTVKRYGVPIRQHKSEKVKRGIGNLGAWTPKRVDYRVPQPGKMGYHQRTEYNKQILKIGQDGKDVNPKGGINRYGLVTGDYVLLHGSIVGPKKGTFLLTHATRVKKSQKDAFTVKSIQ